MGKKCNNFDRHFFLAICISLLYFENLIFRFLKFFLKQTFDVLHSLDILCT